MVAPANEPDGAGARLAGARARAGLSVEQVAEKLRLDRRIIVALEAGDHRAVGAAVFVRGFLRSYAALVGESATEIEALYAQRPDAELRPDLAKTGMHRIAPTASERKFGLVPAVIIAALLAITAVVWWAMRAKPQPYTLVSEERTQMVPGSVASAPLAVPAPVPAAAAPPATATPPALLVRRHLQLSFNGECWVELYDARGLRLFFGFGHAGTTQELSGAPPFRFVLGNVDAVALSAEGAAVSLPPAAPGARVRFTLNAAGAVTGVR